jgi:putative FmdB family regulatory protein
MPIYEYYCPDCSTNFEKLVRLSEANVVPDCPECGEKHAHKKLSAFATSGGTGAGHSASVGSSCGGGGRFS